jgi:hypothetical protein
MSHHSFLKVIEVVTNVRLCCETNSSLVKQCLSLCLRVLSSQVLVQFLSYNGIESNTTQLGLL